jgi:hypothetical protein
MRIRPRALPVRLEVADALLLVNDTRAAIRVLDEAPPFQKSSPALIAEQNRGLWGLGQLAETRKGIDAGLTQGRSAVFPYSRRLLARAKPRYRWGGHGIRCGVEAESC